MRALLRWVRLWKSTPWSLRSAVKRDEAAWFAQNPHRRRLALTRLQRDLLFAGERPWRFAFSLLGLQIALLVLVALLPPDWFSPAWESWQVAEQLTHFSTVWTIQATLAALVYPIVIAFVAVYLQRRPAAEAFIHLYMLDSGGLAAGLSSLTLVVVMGIQYLLLSAWGPTWLPGWAAIDTAWFLLNAALTTFFLFRTVEFLRPDVQEAIIRRYTIDVALPQEVQRLNSFQILASGFAKGWFPLPAYGDEKAAEGPRLLIVRGLREGATQAELPLSTPSRLVDVRVWLVRAVVESWHRKALAFPRSENPDVFGINARWPLLTLPITPGTVYRDSMVLASVADGPELSLLQRWLLRWSVVLTPETRERHIIKVEAILAELAAEARGMAAKPDNEGFVRTYGALVDLHGLLLAACLDKTDTGEQGSWALLPDPESFFDRTLHASWSNFYRGLYETAIESMVADIRPLRRLCHLLQHLNSRGLHSSPVEVREHMLKLPALMMYLLSNWWTLRVEEQAVVEHGHAKKVVLQPPLHRIYEEALSTFVAGWENGRPGELRRSRDRQPVDWRALPGQARLSASHIESTARMLLAAVLRGDQAAAEWLADVLSKWWGTSHFDHAPHQLHDRAAFITIDDLTLTWPEFCKKFGLEADDGETQERLRPVLQEGAFRASLLNHWTDIRLLTVELMLDWVRAVPAQAADDSLALEIATGLLTGKSWKGGGDATESLASLQLPEYLVAKVRQFAASGEWRGGYVGRLDSFVEGVKSMRRPNMVSSRVYSFGGADDVESLQESQLELMAVLAAGPWGLPRALRRQLSAWLNPQSDFYNSVEILRTRLKVWLERLNQEPMSLEHIELLKGRVKPGLSAQAAVEHVMAGLRTVQGALEELRLETLAAQPIDPERLVEIAKFGSSTAFSGETGLFPVYLFAIQTVPEDLMDFTATFPRLGRGELTKLPMDQRPSNEEEYFADTMAQQVARVVLGDVLNGLKIKDIIVRDAKSYWKALKSEARRIVAKGGTPMLLLDNPTRPEWVWDWQHAEEDSQHERPDDLQVRHRDGQRDGYQCDFNDIEIYTAPLPFGRSLLVAKESFKALAFTDFGDGRFLRAQVNELKEPKNLVDLKLTFSRQVEVAPFRAVRLVYAEGLQ